MSQSVNQPVQFKDEEQGKRQIDILSCSPTGQHNEYKLSGIIWDASPERRGVEKIIIYAGPADGMREVIDKDTAPWTEVTDEK